MFSFLSIIGIVKGFFSSDNPSGHNNRLTLTIVSVLVGFIVVLVGMNYFKSKTIEKQKAAASVVQQQISEAVQTNADLTQTLAKQNQTTTDSVQAVVNVQQEKESLKKKVASVKKTKTAQIQQISDDTQTQLSEAKTPEQAQQIKTAEQNKISQVQIDSIWQTYCLVSPQAAPCANPNPEPSPSDTTS